MGGGMLRIARLQEALARGNAEQAIDRLLVESAGPLVDADGVTFLFRDAEVDRVYLHHEIMGLESKQEFLRLEQTSLFYLPMQVPGSARIEYRLEAVRGGRHQILLDPLNPNRSDCPYGEKSVVTGARYQPPEFSRVRPAVRRGEILSLSVDSRVFGERREFLLYLPARYRDDRTYPLLIVHDGPDYLRYAALSTVLDNLMHDREMAEVIVVLTGSPDRLTEYKVDPRQGDFLVRDLLPFLEERWSLRRERESRALMGASYGGLTSLHTFSRYPEFFGLLFSQSGSFVHADVRPRHPAGDDPEALGDDEPIKRFVASFSRWRPERPARLYLTCGRFESLIFFNRSLLNVLQEHGYDHAFRESFDGHNWTCWRDGLRDGFRYLFPGDVLLYYP
jgi:enterochelin esterase family protein